MRRLFAFIDWVMELPEPLDSAFWGEVVAYQQDRAMPYMNIVEKVSMQMGLVLGIESFLRVRSGAEGLELLPGIRELRDHVLLGKVLERIEAASSLDEVRRVWTRRRRPKRAEPE